MWHYSSLKPQKASWKYRNKQWGETYKDMGKKREKKSSEIFFFFTVIFIFVKKSSHLFTWTELKNWTEISVCPLWLQLLDLSLFEMSQREIKLTLFNNVSKSMSLLMFIYSSFFDQTNTHVSSQKIVQNKTKSNLEHSSICLPSKDYKVHCCLAMSAWLTKYFCPCKIDY